MRRSRRGGASPRCPTCKTQLVDAARFCSRCGAVFPAVPLPPRPELHQVPAGASFWLEGKDLVIRQGAPQLPASCVKCGQPAQNRITSKLYWHSPWLYLAILANLLIYAVIALVVRKTITLEVPLCGEHRRQRTRLRWVTAGSLVAAVALPVALAAIDQGALAVTAFVVFLLVATVFSMKARLLVPRYIDTEIAKVRGPCDAFLGQFPRGAA